MNKVYSITVAGLPKAQPRPRLSKNGHVYNPSSADQWKSEIIDEWQELKSPRLDVPCALYMAFYLPIAKSRKEKVAMPHGIKPDLDNLIKACMDALTTAGAWTDDCLVWEITARKMFHPINHGAVIRITTMEELKGVIK